MNDKVTPNPQAKPGEPDKVNGTASVVIGCKLPNGIIMEMGKLGDEGHVAVRINGSNAALVIGGYGMTTVSKELWDKWYAKNKRLEFVRKGLIFAHGDEASARDHAQDNAGHKSGFEAVNPDQVIKNAAGDVILEADANHLRQGRMDIAQATRNRA